MGNRDQFLTKNTCIRGIFLDQMHRSCCLTDMLFIVVKQQRKTT
jgi:hypothetical protein